MIFLCIAWGYYTKQRLVQLVSQQRNKIVRQIAGKIAYFQQFLPDISKVESFWKLEVKLNGGTLMIPAQSILDLNINL